MDPIHFDKAKILVESRPDVKESSITNGKLKLYVEAGEKALPEILPLFVDAKIPIVTLDMSRPSLEEVFLKKTGYSLKEDTRKDAIL